MNSTGVPRTASERVGPAPQGPGRIADETTAHVALWPLWLGLAILWFAAVDVYPLLDPDEGRYAEIPREMLASGDWVTPRLNGLQYFEKPPLQYWATAALYEVAGVSEWTARAWPLALAFLCLPLTFAFARRLHGPRAAFMALAVLASSPFFALVGHFNLLDSGFTFWLTATLFAFVLAQMAPPHARAERNWMLLAWGAAALAVLSKGIVVAVLAGLALLVYSLVQRDWQAWRRLHIASGLPLFLLIAAPWFIAVSARNPQFPGFFFLHEHLARFLTTIHKHEEPLWYFLPFLALAVLPWIASLRDAVRQAWEPRMETGFQPLRFLLIYSAVVLGFFSISGSKLAPYILPLVPPLAVILGAHLAERSGTVKRAAWIVAALVAVVVVGLVVYALRRYDAAPPGLIGWSLAALVIALLAVFSIKARATLARNVAILAAASCLAWQCLMVAYAAPPSARSARWLVNAVQPQVGAGTTLYSVGQYRQSIPVYLSRTVTLVDYQGELEFGMQQEPGRNSLSPADFKRRWRASVDAVAFVKADRWPMLEQEGLPGRVLASDRYSIVVSRR